MNRMDRRVIFRSVGGFVLVVVIVIVLYRVGLHLENSGKAAIQLQELSTREIDDGADVIQWNGQSYKLRNNLFSVLFIGVDKTRQTLESIEGYRNHGQADFLMLAVMDRDAKTVTRLMIDRDTITEITTLGVFGDVSGTRVERVSLSHSFGDGKTQSCIFTMEAVSRILFGMKINSYLSMNLDGIPRLNDAVGGVTVKIEDDFSAHDPTMVPGATVTLHGDQTQLPLQEY